MPIAPIGGSPVLYGTPKLDGSDSSATAGGADFAEFVTRFLKDVNSDQVNASQKMVDLAVHGEGTIHDAMVAVNDAEGSFRLAMEIRNRLVDGVNRLLTTQI